MYTGLSVLIKGPLGFAIGAIPGDGKWRYMFWITVRKPTMLPQLSLT